MLHPAMTRRTRRIHFVGIGGIGMSGIAEVLLNIGYQVRGSDLRQTEVTERLQGLGGDIRLGHEASHVDGVDVVVVSSAVRADNPEVVAAQRSKIPVIQRAEMLAELMRMKFGIAIGGTHGKTTTTSILATMLGHAGLDPTVVVGGKVNTLGSNAKLGQGPYLVAEADESDGSFRHLAPTIVTVTNIDRDHLDHYTGGMDQIRDAFVAFINRIPFYGLAVLCSDHPGVRDILPRVEKRYVTYGFGDAAEYQARAVEYSAEGASFEAWVRGVSQGTAKLKMVGAHNVLNALACLAVADELQVPFATALEGLGAFGGVDRRFSLRGERGGVMVVDDYGHHPAEIEATLDGARRAFPDRRIRAIFQPHRYTRTRDQFEAFSAAFRDASTLLLTPVYAAGESEIEGISSQTLAAAIRGTGHADVEVVHDLDAAVARAAARAASGDLWITFGAGTISKYSSRLLEAIEP